MNSIFDRALNYIKVGLSESGAVTPQEIEEQVDYALSNPLFKNKGIDRDKLVVELQSQFDMVMESFKIIELDDPERRKPWISQLKPDRERWKFWNRYRNYLMGPKGFPQKIVDELDTLTDRILDGLYNPSVSNVSISKKGLVVGQVQSGKTSNYTGLICKAADAGYNLIIVLAGTLNNLRSQTQLRIDEGFLGFDTQSQRAYDSGEHLIGVGKPKNTLPVHSMTDSAEKGDFTAKGAQINFNTSDPIIAVVKKNSSVLKKLYRWLYSRAQGEEGKKMIHSKSLLIIDDEADNASINTKDNPDERTAINGGIRNIVSLFGKSGYVGYTATPFANIFIPVTEQDDLFPRDFIINIPPPPTYIGPEKVFGFQFHDDEADTPDKVLPICFRIDSTKENKKLLEEWAPGSDSYNKDYIPATLPPQLSRAIQCFIITCAIRKLRGQNKEHNSMLVHIARLVKWQKEIKEMVETEFNRFKNGISLNDSAILTELQEAFEKDSEGYLSYNTVSDRILKSPLAGIDANIQQHNWEEVKNYLYEAAVNITVREINGGSKDALNYYDNTANGISVIAIGGDKLSRGLTLEGLSVSYYLRASKMYDTLMQMGRWFGYRRGYTDLCRLFTTKELNEWFCHITHATQELREEFDYMADVAGATPEQYVTKVRTHPGVLQITAANKFRSAEEIQISWAGRLVESYQLKKDFKANQNNLTQVTDFINKINSSCRREVRNNAGNTQLWYDVPADSVMEWLSSFESVDNLKAYSPENLITFIEKQLKNSELTNWRVALMSKKGAAGKKITELETGFFIRREAEDSTSNTYIIRKAHIIDERHESIDLSVDEYNTAMQLTHLQWEKNDKKGNEPNRPSGTIVRNEIRNPQHPLLIIYLLDPEGTDDCKDWTTPFVGYAISFPKSNFSAPVTYAVNKTIQNSYNQEENNTDFDDD